MANWILVPCLTSLRAELNALSPNRDKASDGSIGDTAHQASGTSDHLPDEDTPALRGKDADQVNELHAIDVDNDLKLAGWSMDRVVQIIVTRHRQGLDDRLQYVIWNRKIWSRSWGWAAREYTGASPHTEHGHFSARYTTAQESDTRPWGLLAAAATAAPKPLTEVTMLPINGFLPELKRGMKDPVNGFSMVNRVQKMLGITPDGDYGNDTAAAVKAYSAKNLNRAVDGNTVDAALWKRLLGITDK